MQKSNVKAVQKSNVNAVRKLNKTKFIALHLANQKYRKIHLIELII